MLVNFTGSFLVSVESSREQQVNQLRAYAQLPSGSRAREEQVLRSMGIEGVQGRLFGEPAPWQ